MPVAGRNFGLRRSANSRQGDLTHYSVKSAAPSRYCHTDIYQVAT